MISPNFIRHVFVLILLLIIPKASLADTTKIGVILPLSGPVAEVGLDVKSGIELAHEDNKNPDKIKFIFEDDQFVSKNSVNAIHKLINLDRVNALITFGGGTSSSVAPIAERSKIPMIAITALSSVGKSKSFVSSIFISPISQADAYVAELAKLNIKKIAVITNVQEALLYLRDEFVSKYKEQIVINEEVVPGEANVNTTVTKIRVSQPEAVLLFTLPPHNAMFAKQLRSQGFKGKFFGGVPMYNPSELKSVGNILVGAKVPAPSTEQMIDFDRRFQNKFGRLPISEGYYAYDSASLLIEATKSKDIAGFLKAKLEFQGIAGKYVRSSSNAYEVPAVLKEISEDYVLR